MADLCSNPIYALNNGYIMSWTVSESSDPPVITDYTNTDYWIGATDLMWNSCYGAVSYGSEPSTLSIAYLYHACGNHGGLHISSNMCWFDYVTTTGYDITMWLGFDANKERQCIIRNGTYTYDRMCLITFGGIYCYNRHQRTARTVARWVGCHSNEYTASSGLQVTMCFGDSALLFHGHTQSNTARMLHQIISAKKYENEYNPCKGWRTQNMFTSSTLYM